MRYAILAVFAVLAMAHWFNSAEGQRAKRNILESRDSQTRLIGED
jgi:hypothetical protein